MSAIGQLLIFALDVYMYVIIASVVISWLIAFDVINTRNEQAARLVALLNRATEPVYRRLRKFIPPLGGMDLTPLVVIVAIYFLQNVILRTLVYQVPYGL